MLVAQLLEETAKRYPNYIAIMDEYGEMSYQELLTQTERLKNQFLDAGIKQGVGLGIMGKNSRAFVIAMLAGMACGAVVIPISHQLKQAEIATIIKETQLHAVLDDGSGVIPLSEQGLVFSIGSQSLRLVWTTVSISKPITALQQACFIRYTSGTTGTSKGVVLTHQSVLARVDTSYQALNLDCNDKVLWVLPMAFHFLVTILVYIRAGAGLIICQDIYAQTLIQQANLHQATFLYAAPMHFRLLAADTSVELMPSLKVAISTSSAIPKEIVTQFTQRFNVVLIQAYGIIEAGLPLLDQVDDADIESVGYPATGFEVALLDGDDQVLIGENTGRLALRGAGLFDAYLSPWQLLADCLVNGWFLTGDLAHRQVDGRIRICGREKTMINIAGNKAFPEEIEAVLRQYEMIEQAYVYGQSHPLMGEIVCADVVVKQGAELTVEAVLRFCRTQLSTYKVPQRLKTVTQINQTHSGKIRRV